MIALAFALAWAACGISASGCFFAFWKELIPKLFANRIARNVLRVQCVVLGLSGPAGALAGLLFTWIFFGMSIWKFGWSNPFGNHSSR